MEISENEEGFFFSSEALNPIIYSKYSPKGSSFYKTVRSSLEQFVYNRPPIHVITSTTKITDKRCKLCEKTLSIYDDYYHVCHYNTQPSSQNYCLSISLHNVKGLAILTNIICLTWNSFNVSLLACFATTKFVKHLICGKYILQDGKQKCF